MQTSSQILTYLFFFLTRKLNSKADLSEESSVINTYKQYQSIKKEKEKQTLLDFFIILFIFLQVSK